MKQVASLVDAYLNIETTGISCLFNYITVVGIYVVNGNNSEITQLVGRQVTVGNLLGATKGVSDIYTYNGNRFAIPFIRYSLGINPVNLAGHHDLIYDCWRCNLYGGLKKVERQLNIPRQLQSITGYEAVQLWYKYLQDEDHEALSTLLEYNKEDLINLRALREILAASPG
ncbi:MAG: ribonuclease H-like domain-containing protein [Dehalococcoidales bacterium]|nr:ribonuclease H-like domain-containing protein [Dehalococcoidales bacterium]